MAKPMTDKQYCSCKGMICPYCRSKDVSAGAIDVDADAMTQWMGCDTCEKRWLDVYKLQGWEAVDG